MIELRYCAPNELDISGTVPELHELRRAVLKAAASSAAVIEIDADSSIDPSPYDTVLSKLIVETVSGPTKVSVTNDTVHIGGSSNCLEALASFLNFKSDAQEGDHAHYEHYEGNQWIAPDSVPLVLSVR